MTPPIQNPIQENIYRKYIKRIQELTLQAHTDLREIKITHTEDISLTELKNFETSLHNIKRNISAVCSRLYTWNVSNTRSLAGVNSMNQESDRDRDTKKITKGK